MQLMSTPAVTTAAGDTGGFAMLPKSVQTLMTETPATSASSVQGAVVPRIGDFRALTDFLAAGDGRLRSGTDLDRAMLRQAAQITASLEADPNRRLFSSETILTPAESRKLLSDMLDLGGSDTTAVHDFVTGENMNAVSGGLPYNADSSLDAIFKHPWGEDNSGIDTLARWIGANAGNSDNPYLATTAAETATALGKYFGNASNLSIGSDLGVLSPHLAKTLATTMSPYLGDFANSFTGGTGVPDYGAGALTHGELTNLFRALDSSPEAAAIINQAGAKWQMAMAYLAGANDMPQLSKATGFLASAMQDGMDQELDYLANSAYADQMSDYQSRLNAATQLRLTVSLFPAGAALNAIVPPELEQKMFGGQPDLDAMTEEQRARYKSINVPALTDPDSLAFAYFVGAVAADPSLREQFPGCFDDRGWPDYEKIQKWDQGHGGDWTDWVSKQLSSSGWDSGFARGAGAPPTPGAAPSPGTLPEPPGATDDQPGG